MTPTQGEHSQTALQPIQRFEVVDCIDSKHVPAVIPNASGPWVRYEDHAAQVAALTSAQPAAPQGVVYAELPDERAAFEAHCESVGITRAKRMLNRWDASHGVPEKAVGNYVTRSVQDIWVAWQARASNGQAPATENELWRERLLNEDIAWLEMFAPNTAVRSHIIDVLRGAMGGQAPAGAVGVVRWAAGIEGSQLEVRWKDGAAPPAGTQVYAHTTTALAAPAADYDYGPQSTTVEEAARNVGKWLNERPNRPLDLRDVAMLVAHVQAPAAGAVAGPSLQEIQWRNIRKVVDALADFCFGSQDDPRWGVAHVAIRTSLTAKDGLDVQALKLEPLAAPTTAAQADSQPAPLSKQQICDKFDFLEGMVNEWGFDRIVEAAAEIQANAIAASAQADSVLEDAALAFTATHIDYVARFGGRCRDCADESGVCPGSGLPCADSRKAIKHVFDAIEYGVKHGYIKSPIAARKQGGTHD